MFASIAQLYRCVRHVPLSQLFRRIELSLLRRVMAFTGGRLIRLRPLPLVTLRTTLPDSVFPPRTELVEVERGELFLNQLNCRFSLKTPVNWQLKGVSHTHLQRLAFHYHEFLEATPVAEGVAILLDWIDANPPYQRGYWLDRWNSYAVSIRCVCWMQWLSRHDHEISVEERTKILDSLIQQIQFLRCNLETDICGNHLIKNIRCLLWASAFFEGSAADEWRQVGEHLLSQQLRGQYLPDGMHFELSPAYHCQVFADLVECLTVISEDLRPGLLASLQEAARVVADLTHPDGLTSLMSDGGLHMAYSPDSCLKAFASAGGEIPEARRGFSFSDSGYFGFRSQDVFLVVDCGPACDDVLPAHGHGDILSFEWDVAGQRWIVDAGVFEYEAGEHRHRNRSVMSHNTVSVGERDQCEFIGSFRAGRRGYGECDSIRTSDDHFQLRGHHRAFGTDACNIVHHRSFDADSESLRVRDAIEGTGGEIVTSRLLLHDECQVERIDAFSLWIRRAGTVVHVSSQSAVRICDATWSPDFGVLKKTVRLELDYGVVPCQSGFELRVVGLGASP